MPHRSPEELPNYPVLVYSPENRGAFKLSNDPIFKRATPSIEAPDRYAPDVVDNNEAS